MNYHRFLVLAMLMIVSGSSAAIASGAGIDSEVPDKKTDNALRRLYRRLIDAENAHDIATVRAFLWNSPSTLFVAKTNTPQEGNWAGFWGKEAVAEHLEELYQGIFVMSPDYSRERIVLLSTTVAQTYVPLNITVGYAGQSGTAKPFLMIVDWVKRKGEWKMATDIALPIPPAPPAP